MPVHRTKGSWQYGKSGKKYSVAKYGKKGAKKRAIRQALAVAYSTGRDPAQVIKGD